VSLKAIVEKIPFYDSLVLPLHWGQAVVAGAKNGWPGKKMRVIAVTGTNGKTTTCFMIWKMLNEAGHKTGLLTTVAWGGVNGDENDIVGVSAGSGAEGMDALRMHKQFEHMTTERVGVLNERMKAIYEAGAEFLVLETTSHALVQFRTLGVPVEVAVFTNITHEHLDYHKTFEKYRVAKMKLFKKARFGVVNADDPNAEWFSGVVAARKNYAEGDIFTYGIEQGRFVATEVELDASGVKYSCHDMEGEKADLAVETQIPGKFNVYNSLAAVCVGRRVGLEDAEIARGIRSLSSVEGRMTRIREGQDFEVIVDYAHAPDALEKVFESVGHAVDKGRRIISVHGGAGRRDPSTRAIRGEILGRESDVVIITEDDSRDEDPKEIAAMFVEGAEKAGKKLGEDLIVELDREVAIRKALEMASGGDLVLLLGKGHEKTILRADGPHEFEDIKVAQKILRGLKEK